MNPRRLGSSGSFVEAGRHILFCFALRELVPIGGSGHRRHWEACWLEKNSKEEGRNEPKKIFLQPHPLLLLPLHSQLKPDWTYLALLSHFSARAPGFSLWKRLLSTSLGFLPLRIQLSSLNASTSSRETFPDSLRLTLLCVLCLLPRTLSSFWKLRHLQVRRTADEKGQSKVEEISMVRSLTESSRRTFGDHGIFSQCKSH